MDNIQVEPIAALSDNYIWCIHDKQHAYIVDPGDAQPVLDFLQTKQLTLAGILITHHHWDHTNGIEAILQRQPNLPVYGPDYGNIAHLTHRLKQGDHIEIAPLKVQFEIIEVPGHTLDHIVYYTQGMLFCGDTLFSAGCGRLFEGSAAQMHQSLQKLMQLPDDTAVYCTHEYTLANLAFAQQVEPDNHKLHAYSNWAQQQRNQGCPTLPSQIGREKAINPFLRAHKHGIKQNVEHHVGEQLSDADAVFKAIRQWKDHF